MIFKTLELGDLHKEMIVGRDEKRSKDKALGTSEFRGQQRSLRSNSQQRRRPGGCIVEAKRRVSQRGRSEVSSDMNINVKPPNFSMLTRKSNFLKTPQRPSEHF